MWVMDVGQRALEEEEAGGERVREDDGEVSLDWREGVWEDGGKAWGVVCASFGGRPPQKCFILHRVARSLVKKFSRNPRIHLAAPGFDALARPRARYESVRLLSHLGSGCCDDSGDTSGAREGPGPALVACRLGAAGAQSTAASRRQLFAGLPARRSGCDARRDGGNRHTARHHERGGKRGNVPDELGVPGLCT